MAIVKYSDGGSIVRVVDKEEIAQELIEEKVITKNAKDEDSKNEEEKRDVPSWAR